MQISKRMMETTTYKRNSTIEAKKGLYSWGKWVEGNFQNSFALIYIFLLLSLFYNFTQKWQRCHEVTQNMWAAQNKLAPKEMSSYDCNPTESHRWLEDRTAVKITANSFHSFWERKKIIHEKIIRQTLAFIYAHCIYAESCIWIKSCVFLSEYVCLFLYFIYFSGI